MARVELKSDFTDFYDTLCTKGEGALVYRRFNSKQPSKGEQLTMLKRLGILTIEAKAARNIVSASGMLTVYRDTKDDSKNVVVTTAEADMLYQNTLASEYYAESNNIINRLIQVGARRFRVVLYQGRVVQVEELFRGYNFTVGLPIYSIDYISTNSGMLATGFHVVEQLRNYNLPITAEEVINEIAHSIIEYGIL